MNRFSRRFRPATESLSEKLRCVKHRDALCPLTCVVVHGLACKMHRTRIGVEPI